MFWRRRSVKVWTAIGSFAVAAGAGFPAWQHFYPVAASDGWSYRVYLADFPHVSALAQDEQGTRYLSQELPGRKGGVFSFDGNGAPRLVLGGLSKPDGLVACDGGLVVSQEEGDQPVLWLSAGRSEVLFQGRNVEGVACDGHRIYAIEDLRNEGRLLRYDRRTRELHVLREGLREGEGVAVCPDGEVYYAEKGRHVVKRWRADSNDDEVVVGELNAPGFVACTEDGLWITEDATRRARLLWFDRGGTLHTVLSHLHSAQTLLRVDHDRYLVAEQGRGRVLEVTRHSASGR